MLTVVVADVVPFVRVGITAALRAEGYAVVAAVASGRDVAKAAVEHSPDLVVVGAVNDVTLADLAVRVRDVTDGARVVAMLNRASQETLGALLGANINGVLARAIGPEDFIRAVGRVVAGERYIDPALVAGDALDEDRAPLVLTAREREVLGLLAAGSSNREIAVDLCISLPTVKTHLAHIYDKLDSRNRNEALGRAMSTGLLL